MSNLINGMYGWLQRDLTWRVDIDDAVFRAAVVGCFADAVDAWSSVCGLTFAQVIDVDANIVLALNQKMECAAYSEMPSRRTKTLRAYLHPEKPWVLVDETPRGCLSLFSVLLHEAGHMLGIQHLEPPNVMAPVYDPKPKPLQDGDIAEAVKRYGMPVKVPT